MKKTNVANDLDVVISTRIRFARNICEIPFVSRMTSKQKNEVIAKVKDAVLGSGSAIAKDFSYIHMEEQSANDALALVEAHLISPEFAKVRKDRGLLINNDKNVSIMINEEDHLRIQCLDKGQNLQNLLEYALHLDDLIDQNLCYAFDEKLGFLTHCPTNLGTGLRASVMLFLPALTESGIMTKLIEAISKLGLAVRGMYGEGSTANAYLYQISNQVTLGISEQETVDKLTEIIHKLIEQERNARSTIYNANTVAVKDRIFRAFGIMANAKILPTNEFLKLFSELRLGLSLEILKGMTLKEADELFINAQPSLIMQKEGKELSALERDMKRAHFVNEAVKNIIVSEG